MFANVRCSVEFIACGHNTIRGAAGAAVLNAELMISEGLSTSVMIVMKFGGSSVESKEAIMRVAGIVRQEQSVILSS